MDRRMRVLKEEFARADFKAPTEPEDIERRQDDIGIVTTRIPARDSFVTAEREHVFGLETHRQHRFAAAGTDAVEDFEFDWAGTVAHGLFGRRAHFMFGRERGAFAVLVALIAHRTLT